MRDHGTDSQFCEGVMGGGSVNGDNVEVKEVPQCVPPIAFSTAGSNRSRSKSFLSWQVSQSVALTILYEDSHLHDWENQHQTLLKIWWPVGLSCKLANE